MAATMQQIADQAKKDADTVTARAIDQIQYEADREVAEVQASEDGTTDRTTADIEADAQEHIEELQDKQSTS